MPDLPELLGLGSWAALHQITTDDALVLVASALRGVAGPTPLLKLPWGCTTPPPLHLMVAEGALSRALDSLLFVVREDNRQVIESAHSTGDASMSAAIRRERNAAELRRVMEEAFKSPFAKRQIKPFNQPPELPSGGPPHAGAPPAGSGKAVFLEGNIAADLPTLIQGCGFHTALASMKLGPLLASKDRRRLLAALCDFMDGRSIAANRHRNETGPAPAYAARIQAIFIMDENSRQLAPTEAPELVARALVLDGRPSALPSNPAELQARLKGAGEFYDRFARIVAGLLEIRGCGGHQLEKIAHPQLESHLAFADMYHHAGLDISRVAKGAPLRRLSATLLWALLTMCRHAKLKSPENDFAAMTWAFNCAAKVADEGLYKAAAGATNGTPGGMLPMASRIVRKISLKQPVSERDLIRSFDCQRTSIYRPVLSKLVDAEIIEDPPDRKFIMGPKPLREAQDVLSALPALTHCNH